MKRLIKSVAVIFVLAMAVFMIPAANSYGATKKNNSGVVYKLKDGVLTISGKGKMPKSMTFKRNKKIKKIIINKGVTGISYKAFYRCKNLEQIKIPNTVKQIGAFSFGYTKLKKINIPRSVQVIGDEILTGCKELTEVTLPGSFKLKTAILAVGSNIMDGCYKLKTVNFNTNFNIETAENCSGTRWNVRKNDPKYKSINGVIYTKDGKEIVRVPADRKVLKVAKGCETFCFQSILYTKNYYEASDIYLSCSGLNNIVLPTSIKKIDNTKYISGLKVNEPVYMELQKVVIHSKKLDTNSIITLASCLKQIYRYKSEWSIKRVYPFQNMETIAKMFPKRIQKKSDFYVLDKNTLLSYQGKEDTITVPEGIKIIGDTFFEKKNCKQIILPNSVEEIGERAFYQCKQLEQINLPDGLKKIGSEAFCETKLNKIKIPKNVSVGEDIFSFSDLREAVLPNEMKVIPAYLFNNCRKLRKVNVPEQLQKIERCAFFYTKVDVQSFLNQDSLRSIGEWAFYGVEWMELTVPRHITNIDRGALMPEKGNAKKATIQGNIHNYFGNIFLAISNNITLTFETDASLYFTDIFVETERGYLTGKTSKTTIKWLKVEGIDGYEIEISSQKSFDKNVKNINAGKNQTKLYVDISRKWQYAFVKIRPYKMLNGKKVYGQWSMSCDGVY